VGRLLDRAQAEGAELPGPDGLLSRVARAVLERALAEEMTGHLGYEKHDPAGRGSGNNRNGTTGKTVLTDVGAVDLAVPRDRNGTFEPGTNSILRLPGSQPLKAGARPGDLLVATEASAHTIVVRCANTCATGPAISHAEGHVVFTT